MICFQFPALQYELTAKDHWTREAGLYNERQRSKLAEEKNSWKTGPRQGGGKFKTTKAPVEIKYVASIKQEQEAA